MVAPQTEVRLSYPDYLVLLRLAGMHGLGADSLAWSAALGGLRSPSTTQGSTLVYARYLEPLFTSHERDVDAYLGDLRYTVGGWLQKAFAAAWTLARERLNVSGLLPNCPSARSRLAIWLER
jgi:hypothetical protein